MTIVFRQRLLVLYHAGDETQKEAYLIHPALPVEICRYPDGWGVPDLGMFEGDSHVPGVDGREAIRCSLQQLVWRYWGICWERKVLFGHVSDIAEFNDAATLYVPNVVINNPRTGFRLFLK